MTERLNMSQIWDNAIIEAARDLKDVSEHPESQFYKRRLTLVYGMSALKNSGFITEERYLELCAQLDTARDKAFQTIPFECLPPQVSKDKSDELLKPIQSILEIN